MILLFQSIYNKWGLCLLMAALALPACACKNAPLKSNVAVMLRITPLFFGLNALTNTAWLTRKVPIFQHKQVFIRFKSILLPLKFFGEHKINHRVYFNDSFECIGWKGFSSTQKVPGCTINQNVDCSKSFYSLLNCLIDFIQLSHIHRNCNALSTCYSCEFCCWFLKPVKLSAHNGNFTTYGRKKEWRRYYRSSFLSKYKYIDSFSLFSRKK